MLERMQIHPEVNYPSGSGERCDLCIETDNQKKLFIEIKMMRLKRAKTIRNPVNGRLKEATRDYKFPRAR